MKKLIYTFHYYLDNIILNNLRYSLFNNYNQEMLVYIEGQYINDNNAFYDNINPTVNNNFIFLYFYIKNKYL